MLNDAEREKKCFCQSSDLPLGANALNIRQKHHQYFVQYSAWPCSIERTHHTRLYWTNYGALWISKRSTMWTHCCAFPSRTLFSKLIQLNLFFQCSLDYNYYWIEFICRLSTIYRLLWQFFHLFYLINSLSFVFEWLWFFSFFIREDFFLTLTKVAVFFAIHSCGFFFAQNFIWFWDKWFLCLIFFEIYFYNLCKCSCFWFLIFWFRF